MRHLSNQELIDIFDGTSGKCHLCHKRLAWKNYGVPNARGAWHVDHSRPRQRGGSDYRRNLKPACIKCNCSKRDGSTRTYRSRHGKTRAPLSREHRRHAQFWNGVGFGGLGWLAGRALFGPGPAILAGLLGLALGSSADPDETNGSDEWW